MFGPDAIFWNLSTVAQVLVTLVAFVGLVALWKLDGLRGLRNEARGVLLPVLRDFTNQDALREAGFVPDDESNETLAHLARIIDDDRYQAEPRLVFSSYDDVDRYVEYGRLMTRAREFADEIKESLRKLIQFGISGTLLALGMLPFVERLASADWWLITMVLSFSLAVLTGSAFYYAWQTLRIGLQDIGERRAQSD